MKVVEDFGARAMGLPPHGEPKKLFVFTWHDHINKEQGQSEPMLMTQSEAQERFRQMVAADFSPFLTRSFHEGESKEIQ